MICMKLRFDRLLLLTIMTITLSIQHSVAQKQDTYMRIAKITVDSIKLNDYLIALKAQMTVLSWIASQVSLCNWMWVR